LNNRLIPISCLAQSDHAGSAIRLDFASPSGIEIETAVLNLPHRKPRLVICTPSQLGCSFGCRFCGLSLSRHATNLAAQEIIDLVDQSRRMGSDVFGHQIESDGWQISFMGQGEPLANLDNVLKVIEYYLSAERKSILFGISTVGIPTKLGQLAAVPRNVLAQIKLQLSLHASLDHIRHELLPGTRGWSIQEMLEVAKRIARRSGRRVCLNYILIDGINDDETCLEALVSLADPDSFYVKLTILNEVNGSNLVGSCWEVVQRFAHTLSDSGRVVKVFHSAGRNVNAGCGQLGSISRPVLLDEVSALKSQYQSAVMPFDTT
jgi:23S rRNA (adenine2503-C2)-methyltransferase